jgi:hypothetical protein
MTSTMTTTNINPTTQKADNETIARAAYLEWIGAGKPTGRDLEFWLKAEEKIRHGSTARPLPPRKDGGTTSRTALSRSKK